MLYQSIVINNINKKVKKVIKENLELSISIDNIKKINYNNIQTKDLETICLDASIIINKIEKVNALNLNLLEDKARLEAITKYKDDAQKSLVSYLIDSIATLTSTMVDTHNDCLINLRERVQLIERYLPQKDYLL